MENVNTTPCQSDSLYIRSRVSEIEKLSQADLFTDSLEMRMIIDELIYIAKKLAA